MNRKGNSAIHEIDIRNRNWQQLRFGMFIHFGLYSVPAGVWNGKKVEFGYSEQIFHHGHITKTEYEALAAKFNPINFDPDQIAGLAVDAGMKYIIITSKHHDGFSMFHTKHSRFNVVDATPYGQDIVKQLAQACARHGLKFGVYFSWIDWHYPHAMPMSLHNSDPIPPKHMEFNLAQVEELMSNYGPIVEVWFDMGAPTPEQSRDMAAVVRRLQPDAMINGRIWNDQGDFVTLGDNELPTRLIADPWQTPASIYHSTWGYRSWQLREDLNGKIADLTSGMRQVFEQGGNYLLNIGPRGDGSIVEFEAEVLHGIGKWIRENQILDKKPRDLSPDIQEFSGNSIILCGKNAQNYHHYTGRDYGSYKALVVKRSWRFPAPRHGDYGISLEGRKEWQTDLRIEIAGCMFTAGPSATPENMLVGSVSLEAGTIYELILSLVPDLDFASNPQVLDEELNICLKWRTAA